MSRTKSCNSQKTIQQVVRTRSMENKLKVELACLQTAQHQKMTNSNMLSQTSQAQFPYKVEKKILIGQIKLIELKNHIR